MAIANSVSVSNYFDLRPMEIGVKDTCFTFDVYWILIHVRTSVLLSPFLAFRFDKIRSRELHKTILQ